MTRIIRRDLLAMSAMAVFAAGPARAMSNATPAQTPEERLAALGITLPMAPSPVATYVPVRRVGNLLWVAGQGPAFGTKNARGKLGRDLSVDQGYAAARSTAINILAQLRAATGSLDNIKQCVKLGGFVNSTPDFTDQPKVINGASDLFVEVFGEAGKAARYAVSAPSLPFDVAVEIESVWEVK